MNGLVWALVYLAAAPIVGGLVAGVDRVISARMQSRVGPPVLQPFYDVLKLLEKSGIVVNNFQSFYAACFLAFMMVTGCIFFSGGDMLLTVFALTLASVFLVLGAYAPNSPYSNIGAERELLQMMAYEPVLLLTVLGMYQVTGSFSVASALESERPLAVYLPGIFLSFLFILTIKLRKSPFDISGSHHAHQELVRGITTEFSGPTLALVEIAHWYENVLLLGFVSLFFAAYPPAVALAAVAAVYLLEIFIDNTYARLTWRFTLKASWLGAGGLALVNLLVVSRVLP